MSLLIKNIKGLVGIDESGALRKQGAEMNTLDVLDDAFLKEEKGVVTDYGPMTSLKSATADQTIDASGSFVMPSFVDSHTHVVWAGDREGEFVDRIHGLTYEEIAQKGGGILNSAKKLSLTSEDDLYHSAVKRIQSLMQMGTGALEIKSGYGLTPETELKMLRVIQRLKRDLPLTIKATFLGAHAYPLAFRENHLGYLKQISEVMLPVIGKERLADFIDVFCERGYFSVEETVSIMQAGKKHGLIPKIHVNQFNALGGVKAAVENGALSVDHLEEMNPEDFEALIGSKTMAVVLPGCSFFLEIPYAPARKMIDKGLGVAIASDYNPGSTPSGNLQLAVAMACVKMKLTPEEALNAVTMNGAYALGLSEKMGSITRGKEASFFITKPLPSYAYIPYAFGENHVKKAFIKGEQVF